MHFFHTSLQAPLASLSSSASSPASAQEPAELYLAARAHLLSYLMDSFQGAEALGRSNVSTAVLWERRAAFLDSVRSFLATSSGSQRKADEDGASDIPPRSGCGWTEEVVSALAPSISCLARLALRVAADSAAGAAAQSASSCAAAALRLLVAIATRGEATSPAASGQLLPTLRVLAQLLIEAASPSSSTQNSQNSVGFTPPPPLRDLAIRLFTTLPSSTTAGEWVMPHRAPCSAQSVSPPPGDASSGSLFRSAVAALPAHLKARLQAAIRETSSTASPSSPSHTQVSVSMLSA